MWTSYRSQARSALSTKRNKDNSVCEKRPSRGAFFVRINHDRLVSSDLEHFSEGPCIGRQGKRPDPMPLCRRLYFRLQSEGAEKDRKCSSPFNGFQKLVSAIGMIAINDYGTGFFPEDRILDVFRPPEKLRLQALKLHH